MGVSRDGRGHLVTYAEGNKATQGMSTGLSAADAAARGAAAEPAAAAPRGRAVGCCTYKQSQRRCTYEQANGVRNDGKRVPVAANLWPSCKATSVASQRPPAAEQLPGSFLHPSPLVASLGAGTPTSPDRSPAAAQLWWLSYIAKIDVFRMFWGGPVRAHLLPHRWVSSSLSNAMPGPLLSQATGEERRVGQGTMSHGGRTGPLPDTLLLLLRRCEMAEYLIGEDSKQQISPRGYHWASSLESVSEDRPLFEARASSPGALAHQHTSLALVRRSSDAGAAKPSEQHDTAL
ncbi:hypothetical protein HaLaN_20903, partial [Haematococcus lacustris]